MSSHALLSGRPFWMILRKFLCFAQFFTLDSSVASYLSTWNRLNMVQLTWWQNDNCNPFQTVVLNFVFNWVEALRPSQQFFSHVGAEPALPGYYQYFLGGECILLKEKHGDPSEDRTPTSRFGIRRSTTRPPRLPKSYLSLVCELKGVELCSFFLHEFVFEQG